MMLYKHIRQNVHNFNEPDRQTLAEEIKVERGQGIWFKAVHQVNGKVEADSCLT